MTKRRQISSHCKNSFNSAIYVKLKNSAKEQVSGYIYSRLFENIRIGLTVFINFGYYESLLFHLQAMDETYDPT